MFLKSDLIGLLSFELKSCHMTFFWVLKAKPRGKDWLVILHESNSLKDQETLSL